MTQKQHYFAWTDGSCDNLNPKRPGGAAYIILDEQGNEIKRKSKGFIGTTNNRMELLAIISVVNSLPNGSSVHIYTDSEYCIKAVKMHNPKKNSDQLVLYHKIVGEKQLYVSFEHVRGHAGNPLNEECDKMARKEYSEMKKAYKYERKKHSKQEKKSPTWTNELEEQYYTCITTKNRRKGVRNKRKA